MNMEKFNKVAEITLIFWLMKIVATTLGETLGDYLSMTLNLGYLTGILITLVFFFVITFIPVFSKKLYSKSILHKWSFTTNVLISVTCIHCMAHGHEKQLTLVLALDQSLTLHRLIFHLAGESLRW